MEYLSNTQNALAIVDIGPKWGDYIGVLVFPPNLRKKWKQLNLFVTLIFLPPPFFKEMPKIKYWYIVIQLFCQWTTGIKWQNNSSNDALRCIHYFLWGFQKVVNFGKKILKNTTFSCFYHFVCRKDFFYPFFDQ